MESFKLNILTLVPQEVHHRLEVILVGDVSGHNAKIGAIEEDLSQELERLPFSHVVGGRDQPSIVVEELHQVISCLDKIGG